MELFTPIWNPKSRKPILCMFSDIWVISPSHFHNMSTLISTGDRENQDFFGFSIGSFFLRGHPATGRVEGKGAPKIPWILRILWNRLVSLKGVIYIGDMIYIYNV